STSNPNNNAVLKAWPAECEGGIDAVNGGSELKIERALVLRRHALPICLLPHLDLAYLVRSPLEEAHFRRSILRRVVKETNRQQHRQAIGQSAVEDEIEARLFRIDIEIDRAVQGSVEDVNTTV